MRFLTVALLVAVLAGCGGGPSSRVQEPVKESARGDPPKIYVVGAAFSPDSKYLLTRQWWEGSLPLAKEFDTLTLWEVSTGRRIWGISRTKHMASAFAFLPDGQQILFLDLRWLFTGEEGQLLRLCDTAAGKVVRTFDGDASDVNCLAVFPDGKQAVLGMRDGLTLEYLDLKTGKRTEYFPGGNPYGAVGSVVISPDGKLIITTSSPSPRQTSDLHVWDSKTGQWVHAFPRDEGWENEPTAIAPDSKTAAVRQTQARKGYLVIWDLIRGQLVRRFETWRPPSPSPRTGPGCSPGITARGR
jgi:WD40 repeat protein